MIPKQKRIKSKAITNSARGENCTLRIYGKCNHDPETTVFAHYNGAGMGIKADDIFGVYACSGCHDWLDKKASTKGFGHANVDQFKNRKDAEFLRALMETQRILFDRGLIKL